RRPHPLSRSGSCRSWSYAAAGDRSKLRSEQAARRRHGAGSGERRAQLGGDAGHGGQPAALLPARVGGVRDVQREVPQGARPSGGRSRDARRSDRPVPGGVRQELRQGHGAGGAARRAVPHRAGVVRGDVPVAAVRAGGGGGLLPPPVHARPWRQAGRRAQQDHGRGGWQAAAVPDLAAL
ncbi:11-beta-hydroxysteroid dehydrogenase 1A, partial [Zea mays]